MSGTELDPAAAAWLRGVLRGRRITAAEPLGGGYRNENIRLVTDGGSHVLRRYLRPALPITGISARPWPP